MAGHSKWSQIKHKKAIADSKKGKVWTRISNMITVAVKGGGSDPEANFKLRLAIDKAKQVNMPKENIDRAIKRGTGELKETIIEEIRYEGYGPGRVAIIVNGATDNRNRTASEVRAAFLKYGGKLGETGTVGWMFSRKGEVVIESSVDKKEDLMLLAIDFGAQDVQDVSETELVIYTESNDLEKASKRLTKAGFKILSTSLLFVAENEVEITDSKTTEQLTRLVEALKEIDDVSEVVTNFKIPDELL